MTKKIALITGASKGIGYAIAGELLKRGYFVIGTYTSNYSEEQLALFQQEGLILKKSDVSQFDACMQLVHDIQAEYGSIDVLVNNAGITKDNLVLKMEVEDFKQVIDVNLVGSFHMIKAVSKGMLRKKAGRIINISSIIGEIGNIGQANYAASKAGIIGLTKSIAKEFASRNITVNAIAPGFIESDMTKLLDESIREKIKSQIPLSRFGQPEDIAKAVAFLASDDASYITGQVIQVCGGMVM